MNDLEPITTHYYEQWLGQLPTIDSRATRTTMTSESPLYGKVHRDGTTVVANRCTGFLRRRYLLWSIAEIVHGIYLLDNNDGDHVAYQEQVGDGRANVVDNDDNLLPEFGLSRKDVLRLDLSTPRLILAAHRPSHHHV